MKTRKSKASESRYLIFVETEAPETDAAIREGVPMFLDRVHASQLGEGEDLHEGLVKRFGEERADQALSDAVMNYLLPLALRNLELEPACSPVPVGEPTPHAGEPFSFEANVYVLPQMELSDYETPVSVSVERSYTTESEIDQQLLALAAHFSTVGESELTGNQVRTMPAIDDEWVATVYPVPGINTVEDLRAQLRNRLDTYKESDFENRKVNAAVAALSQRLEGEAPQEIVDIIAKDMIADVEEEVLAEQGKVLDTVLKEQKIKREDFDRAMYDRACDSVREGLTMDAVFRHEGMEVTDGDIEDAIRRISANAGDEAAVLQAQTNLREMGRTPELVEVARRLKAGQWIADHAQITVEV